MILLLSRTDFIPGFFLSLTLVVRLRLFPFILLLRIMDEIINHRYSKKVQFESFSYSRTSNIYNHLNRKESSDSSMTESFKNNKYLPRLETMKDSHPRRINLSTDIKKIEQASMFNSHNREKHNFTKFTIPPDSDEPLKKYVACNKQGKRSYNEDRYICKIKNANIFAHHPNKQTYDLFAVFDGHGGATCAEFLKDNFSILLSRSKTLAELPEKSLKETFEKCEEKFLQFCELRESKDKSGSCAVVCMVAGGKVITANLGDSRALMFNSDKIQELTKDHKPFEITEKMRIIKHGGKIYKEVEGTFNQIKLFHQFRILPGNLNVSRTIGDIEVKLRKYGGLPGMISSVPDICTFDKSNYDVLLLGSDGLFEAFSNEQIREFYQEAQSAHKGLAKDRLLKIFVQSLCESAEKKSTDNITIIGVSLGS